MINQPFLVEQDCFQTAWKEATCLLKDHGWEIYNLVVNIKNPTAFDDQIHENFSEFCVKNSLLKPKHVAYTIFPHNLYKKNFSANEVFDAYNRDRGLFHRLRSRPRSGWGTYFRRMTCYEINGHIENQLNNIIQAINSRPRISKASYTIIIQKPGYETVRPRGGPCLNYLAIQMEPRNPNPLLGLLGIYRNHDFLIRAYGNYWGLCNLICFLAKETNTVPGPLTCISSHAYVDRYKADLAYLLRSL